MLFLYLHLLKICTLPNITYHYPIVNPLVFRFAGEHNLSFPGQTLMLYLAAMSSAWLCAWMFIKILQIFFSMSLLIKEKYNENIALHVTSS